MKNLKTKTCANSICGKSFSFKSAMQNYCCLHCKHQAAFTHRVKVMHDKSKSIKELLNKIYYN
jgi:hypothetical protein